MAKKLTNVPEERQHHIQCSPGEVGKYVLLPGDPFRTDVLAQQLKEAKVVAHNREHKTWTGFLAGEKVSITSTGMGGPSAAIAVEELVKCGADTFIRIGTSGRVSQESCEDKWTGAIATAAIRDEGTTRQYISLAYPAVANRKIVAVLSEAAKELNVDFLEGIVHCKDSYYAQHAPETLPNSAKLKAEWEMWQAGNTVASEMETSTLFVLSSIRNVRAGAILAYGKMNDETVAVAFKGLEKLIEEDRK